MRLIDADAYRAAMKGRQDACVKWRNEARENGDAEDLVRAEQALSGFIEAKLTLDHTPTVDAVPVVRCKDCKHWQLSPYTTTGIHICMKKFRGVRMEHDFCSRGERKEQDDGT